MFKKDRDLTVRSKTLLKNKETRTLLTEVLKQYPTLTEENLHEVIPKKSSITVVKLASRTLLYIVDNVPMLFDKDDRNQLFPTVFMLWKLPSMMRQILIPSAVSGFLFNGADLMLPGVTMLTDFSGLKCGERVCVRTVGNPLPFAVGESSLSEESIANRGLNTHYPSGRAAVQVGTLLQGLQGRAVEVLHVYGDCLTLLGPGAMLVPNIGFTRSDIRRLSDFVDPLEASLPTPASSVSAEATAEEADVTAAVEELEESEEAIDSVEAVRALTPNHIDNEDSEAEEAANEPSDDEPSLTSATQPTSISMDEHIVRCVGLVIKYVVKDTALPILVSTVWPIILRAPQPYEPEILLRKSTFKKVSTLFKSLQKQGALVVEDDSGISSITSVARSHPLWASCKLSASDPTDVAVAEDSNQFRKRVSSSYSSEIGSNNSSNAADGSSSSSSNSSSSNEQPMFLNSSVAAHNASLSAIIGSGSLSKSKSASSASTANATTGTGDMKINVVELYKPPRSFLRSIFAQATAELADSIFRASEVRSLLSQYIITQKYDNHIAITNKAFVAIDSSSELYGLVNKIKSAIVIDTGSASTDNRNSTSNDDKDIYKLIENAEELEFEKFRIGDDGDDGDKRDVNELNSSSNEGNNNNNNNNNPETEQHKLRNIEVTVESEQPEQSEQSEQPLHHSVNAMNNSNGFRVESVVLASAQAQVAPTTTSNTASKVLPDQLIPQTKINRDPWKRDASKPFQAISLPSGSSGGAGAKHRPAAKGSTSVQTTARVPTESVSKPKKPKAPAADLNAKELMVKRDELLLAVLGGMTKYHGIERDGQFIICSGPIPKIHIVVEKRAGSAVATRVLGLDHFAIDIKAFTKYCQKKFACSVTSGESLTGGIEAVMQGHLALEVEEYLTKSCGIPRSVFEVDIRKGVKPKK